MNIEMQAKLREPFKASQTGKLPKVFCTPCVKDTCSDQTHKRQKCKTCKAYITTAHMHVKFVGHAEVTARLLEVDPDWNWEPIAFDSFGSPAMDGNGGMWIKLTIGGLTRLGYGFADGKRGGNAVKETIGDALRNAAMRFGVALDLWQKDKEDAAEEAPTSKVERTEQTEEERKTELRRKISLAGQRIRTWDINQIADEFTAWSGEQQLDIRSANIPALAEFLVWIQREDA